MVPFQKVDMAPFYDALPFTLTGAQRRCVEEAITDMASGAPMNRLCQGDVGSGKTMVAAACIYFAAQNGYQSALMAPTELLAQQHYHSLAPLLEQCGFSCGLLTGSTPAKEKHTVTTQLSGGEVDFAIGTHALIAGEVDLLIGVAGVVDVPAIVELLHGLPELGSRQKQGIQFPTPGIRADKGGIGFGGLFCRCPVFPGLGFGYRRCHRNGAHFPLGGNSHRTGRAVGCDSGNLRLHQQPFDAVGFRLGCLVALGQRFIPRSRLTAGAVFASQRRTVHLYRTALRRQDLHRRQGFCQGAHLPAPPALRGSRGEYEPRPLPAAVHQGVGLSLAARGAHQSVFLRQSGIDFGQPGCIVLGAVQRGEVRFSVPENGLPLSGSRFLQVPAH